MKIKKRCSKCGKAFDESDLFKVEKKKSIVDMFSNNPNKYDIVCKTCIDDE